MIFRREPKLEPGEPDPTLRSTELLLWNMPSAPHRLRKLRERRQVELSFAGSLRVITNGAWEP